MEQRLRVAHILFIFLPVFLLASPVYASMGDINICFPFFLLLAALMAAMLAQGKSPLVGFDISAIRPPAQIRSTSYHFKSFGAGGFETEMALRNKMGGGNILTRGAGAVANAVGKGGAKAVSKASGGKYGSGMAKEGVAWAKTMKERGALFAVTKHSQRAQTLVRGVGGAVSKVPIVRARWRGFGKGGEGKRGAISRWIPIGKNVSHKGELAAKTGLLGGGYQAHYQKQKYVRMDERIEAEHERNVARGKVVSLRKTLNKLGRGKITDAKKKKIDKAYQEMLKYEGTLSQSKKDVASAKRDIAVLEEARKWAGEYRKTLADHAGVKGILMAPVYPVAVGAGLVATGVILPGRGAKRKLEKYINEKKLDKIAKLEEDVQKLEKTDTKGLNAEEKKRLEKQLQDKKRELGERMIDKERLVSRNKELSRKSVFSTIFMYKQSDRINRLNTEIEDIEQQSKTRQLTKRQKTELEKKKKQLEDLKGRGAQGLLKATGKSALYNAVWGVPNQFVPYEEARGLWKKYASEKPQVRERNLNLQDHIGEMKRQLNDLKDPNMLNADKVRSLRDIARLQKQIPKESRSGHVILVRNWKGVRKVLLNRNQKELNEAHSDVSKNLEALKVFYRDGGKAKSVGEKDKLKNLRESIRRRNTIIDEFGIPAEFKSLKEKQLKPKMHKIRKNTRIEKNLERARRWLKNKPKVAEGSLEDLNQQRSSNIALAKFLDNWREAKKENRGKTGLMSTSMNLLNFGISGIEKAQEVRHMASEWENQIGPLLVKIEREKAKTQELKKLLGMQREEEKKRSRMKNLKTWFYQKTGREMKGDSLYADRAKTKELITSLGTTLTSLSDKKVQLNNELKKAKSDKDKEEQGRIAKQIEKTEDQLKQTKLRIERKKNEFHAINASIMNAKIEIGKSERSIRRAADFLLSNEVQLAYRQKKAFKEGEDKFSEKTVPKIEKFDKSIEKNRQKIEGINQKMEDLERNETKKPEYAKDPAKMRIALGLVHDSKEYKKLQKEFSTIQNDVNKKRQKRAELEASIENEEARINGVLKEAREKTRIKIGGDDLLKKKDRINRELVTLELNRNATPSYGAVNLIQSLAKPEEQTKDLAYYKNHIDEYKRDLKEAKKTLKNEWNNLKTMDAGKWIHDEMQRVGDNRFSRETGLYRDRLELNQLSQPIVKNIYKIKRKGPLEKQLDTNMQVIESDLYLTNLEFTRVIDVGTAYQYKKQVDRIQEMRESCPDYADTESRLIDSRIKLIEAGELNEAKEAGWTSEIERLNNRVKELKEQRDKWSSIVKKPPTTPVSYNALRNAEDELIRTAHMHQTAELLQREDYSKTIGGLMQDNTRERLKKITRQYSGDKDFWNEAENWAGRTEKKETDTIATLMSTAYEDKMIGKRAEVKSISEKIDKIRNKPEYLNNQPMSDKDSKKLKSLLTDRKDKQRELKEIHDEWRTVRDYHRSVNEPFRTAEKFTGPGSEKHMEKYLEESAEDVRKRLWASRFEPIAGPASKAVEKLSKFATKGGGLAIAAATIAAPYVVLPIAGAGAAAAVTFGGAGIFWAKSYLRGSDQNQGADRVSREIIAWSSHLTGRGSGAPPSTWEGAWGSQLTGTEYMTRALRLNEYGEIKARKETMDLPDVGLPWYIRWAKVPVEGPTSAASILARRAMLRMEWWAGEEEVKRIMAENPMYIPEIKDRIQYQHATPFGANVQTIFPKQAWEMTEYRAIALNVPFQEEAKNVVISRNYAPDPLGMRFHLNDPKGLFRPRTGAAGMMVKSETIGMQRERMQRERMQKDQGRVREMR